MIFRIENPLGEKPFYVVDAVEYTLPETANAVFGTKETAEATLDRVRSEVIAHASYRFTITEVVVSGNDTVWREADITKESAGGSYSVFNHKTGVHEELHNLTAAITRRNELIDEYFAELGLAAVTVVQTIPADVVVTVVGANTL